MRPANDVKRNDRFIPEREQNERIRERPPEARRPEVRGQGMDVGGRKVVHFAGLPGLPIVPPVHAQRPGLNPFMPVVPPVGGTIPQRRDSLEGVPMRAPPGIGIPVITPPGRK